ncbi:MAG: DUF2974 domain-containing protein [Bifidobacteriaceae bacterium]|nr:DUF2974 domain-containing protein [Bifidobacteriaceae bacterium]
MANIIDYVKTEMRRLPAGATEQGSTSGSGNGGASANADGIRPFHDVDSLVLSQIAYVHMPDNVPRMPRKGPALPTSAYVPIHELLRAECYGSMFPTKGAESSLCALVTAMAASPRFRTMRIGNYISVEDDQPGHEKQFAAVSVLIDDDTEFVAFRGSEDSLAAWKENFNMAFTCPIPAQTSAAKYLERVAAASSRRLIVGGHSKGGNLAVYASMKAPEPVRKRIQAIYSHDGPGFEQRVLESLDFERIKPLVHKTVPEASIIGMIFETQEDFRVIESTSHGIAEHFAMTWKVKDGDFVYVPQLPQGTRYVNRTLNDWVAHITPAERQRVLGILFDILRSTGCESFSDMAVHWRESLPAIGETVKDMPPADRKLVVSTFKVLFSTALRTARSQSEDSHALDGGLRSDGARSDGARLAGMQPGGTQSIGASIGASSQERRAPSVPRGRRADAAVYGGNGTEGHTSADTSVDMSADAGADAGAVDTRVAQAPRDAQSGKQRIKDELHLLREQYKDVKRLNKQEAQRRKELVKREKRDAKRASKYR